MPVSPVTGDTPHSVFIVSGKRTGVDYVRTPTTTVNPVSSTSSYGTRLVPVSLTTRFIIEELSSQTCPFEVIPGL